MGERRDGEGKREGKKEGKEKKKRGKEPNEDIGRYRTTRNNK